MMTRRGIGQGIFFLLFLLLLSSSGLTARERVGVLDFGGNVQAQYQNSAANRLTRILMDLERFDVIERGEMDRILSEQHFQLTGLVDMDTAVEVGQILGITQAFVGSIDHLSSSWDQGSYQADARVTVKVMDVETSTLLHLIESSGSASDQNRSTSLHRALESALGERFINQLRERFAITSIITRVEGKVVYLMGGQDMGIKKDYRYRILRLDDPGASPEDAFYQEVGLLEIVDVSASRSRGQVLYASTTVQPNDVAWEVPYNTRSFMGLRLQSLQYSLDAGRVTGTAPLLEFIYCTERPFHYSWGLSLGFSSFQDISFIHLGVEGGMEFPMAPGRLYFTVDGGGGFFGAVQSVQHWASSSATAGSFYVLGKGGIKYYLDYDRGIRLHLGAAGRYGGTLTSWESDEGRDLSDYVEYNQVNINGLSVQLSIRIPLGFGIFQ